MRTRVRLFYLEIQNNREYIKYRWWCKFKNVLRKRDTQVILKNNGRTFEVDIVEIEDTEIFKDEEISFIGTYQYCPIEDKLLETEEMMRNNSLAIRDIYRKR